MTSEGVEMEQKELFEIWIPAFIVGVLGSFSVLLYLLKWGDPRPWMVQIIFVCVGFLMSRLMDTMRAEK